MPLRFAIIFLTRLRVRPLNAIPVQAILGYVQGPPCRRNLPAYMVAPVILFSLIFSLQLFRSLFII